ncbi:MAG: aldehyde dehydrogenase EutE [Verrucomicrobia bacterium]|nr:aldehyde dehydrogenase EutE [Verrucomicrobiota bacterium]
MSSGSGVNEALIREVVEQVLTRLDGMGTPKGNSSQPTCANKRYYGVFQDAAEACTAAEAAYRQLQTKGVAGRNTVISIVKKLTTAHANEWGKIELEETKIGRLDHKVDKLLGLKNLPGVEFLKPNGMSGDHGITMEEFTPFGVIGAITPSTHSIPTLACNVISMVAAGNAVVFNPHPGASRCATTAARVLNEAIFHELGIENLISIVEHPTLDSFQAIATSPHVKLLCVTGGPGVVKAAMKSGKRAICAGPGNPPVLVDETADLAKAAQGIIAGGAYDNNLLCIGEKEVFVVESVFNRFMEEMARAGAVKLNEPQVERLAKEAFVPAGQGGGVSHMVVNRDLVGRDACVLAKVAGANIPQESVMLFAETDASHLFVQEEQMMPFIPIVKVRNVEEGIQRSLEAEHNYKHTAIIHSYNVNHMTAMARALDTTIFVKNGSSLCGLGSGGEGYASFSIATPTGEGITTPRTFTRIRRCVMVDNLRIY